MILGLDTSKWEDNPSTAQTIDWNMAKAANVKFLIMKATEGISYTDPVYSLHSQATKGMFLRGHYHFWRIGQPAKSQAAYYFKQAGKLDLPPILDVEDWYHDLPMGITLENKILEMLREIDYLFGRPCILYTSPNIIKNYLALQSTSDLVNRKLWIANYGVTAPIISPWKKYTFWQFSEKGDAKKYGINEALNVDENWYPGTEAEMYAEFSGTELPVDVVTPPLVAGASMTQQATWVNTSYQNYFNAATTTHYNYVNNGTGALTMTSTANGNNQQRTELFVALSGVSQTAPLGTSVNNTTIGTAQSANTSDAIPGDLVLGFLLEAENGNIGTSLIGSSGSGQTSLLRNASTYFVTGVDSKTATAALTTMSFTLTASKTAMVVVFPIHPV